MEKLYLGWRNYTLVGETYLGWRNYTLVGEMISKILLGVSIAPFVFGWLENRSYT